ncbi:MAG TPA: undecaprenyl-diphosphate phosphatase [Verrucomicrobiae bacterium]|nr:undecaprenyl-diphosphate phosphatase [Verrucomicrobiae bacterium]
MPEWLSVIILGIIEGITEFLPISSTGHLLLAEHWIPRQSDLFNIVIQTAAVMAVIPLFAPRFRALTEASRAGEARNYFIKVLAAFFITGVLGFILEKRGFKLPEEARPIGIALLIGGVLFLAIEAMIRGKRLGNEITWAIAGAVGIGQVIAAIFPGASRSGTTILIMLVMGLSRPAATEFSFLVSIPTMIAAGALKIFKALHHPAPNAVPEHWGMVILGSAVAAVVSFIAVKWLLRFVQSHTFNGFGWYRIAAGLAVLLLMR